MSNFVPLRVGREAMLAMYFRGKSDWHRADDHMSRAVSVTLADHGLLVRTINEPNGARVKLTDLGRAMCDRWSADGKTVQP